MKGLLALALAVWAGAATAQVRTDAAGMRELAAGLLAQGEPERAADLAQALLARDGGDLDALLLLARASLAAEDWERALPAARAAHARADGEAGGRARFLAARIAARAHAEMGHWTRARLWLRRAAEDVPSEEAARDLAQEFRAVRALDPLTLSLSFGLAPSSNVNGGSRGGEYLPAPWWNPDLPFVIGGDGLALSGLRLSGGARLSYRLRGDARSSTLIEARADGRTYILSPEAREQAPEAEGSDFSDMSLSFGLSHRWRGEGERGGSSVTGTLTQTWYDGDPYLRIASLAYDRGFVFGDRDRLDLSLTADWTDRRKVTSEERPGQEPVTVVSYESYPSWGARLRWTHALPSGDRASFSFGLRDVMTDLSDTGYNGATLGASWDRAEPWRGLRLGFSGELEWRDYDTSGPFRSPDWRRDLRGTLRASVGLTQWDLYGFEPVVGIEASRTESEVSRYDRQSLTLDLSFRSAF